MGQLDVRAGRQTRFLYATGCAGNGAARGTTCGCGEECSPSRHANVRCLLWQYRQEQHELGYGALAMVGEVIGIMIVSYTGSSSTSRSSTNELQLL